jgi:cytochrome P450
VPIDFLTELLQNDLLTWMIRESNKRTTESERSPESLAYRLLLLNFAAVSTSTIGATNAVLDILAAPDFHAVLPALREEAAAALEGAGGLWTKSAVQSLRRLDSALRESARVSGVGGTGLARRVRAADGITLPDGTWVPRGATLGVAQGGVHFDTATYGPTAGTFDALRFSRAREEAEARGTDAPANEDLVTTSPQFLAFSHGLHAWSVSLFVCAIRFANRSLGSPGRFFAANQLKLILAHLLLTYDVQPLPARPPNTPLGDVMIPPLRATMRIRRRVVKA